MTPRSRIMLVVGMTGCVSVFSCPANAQEGTQTAEQGSAVTTTRGERGLEAAGSDDGTVGHTPSEASTAIDRAEQLFDTAYARYMDGDVTGALAAMEESYALSHRPELLFNLGQLNRALERCRPAIAYYEQYLSEMPVGSGTEDATAAIEALAPTCETPPPATTTSTLRPPVPAPPPAPPSDHPVARGHYWTPLRVAGWSAILAGAGLGAGALYFQLRANRLEDQVERKYEDVGYDPELELSGKRSATAAQTMAVVAASAIVGGVLLLWVGHHNETQAQAVSIGVRSDGMYTSCSVRF
jgi:hypothetical protein